MKWRTANRRRKAPRQICRAMGHDEQGGYGFAFGGGIGSYSFCGRCGAFFGKTPDNGDEE